MLASIFHAAPWSLWHGEQDFLFCPAGRVDTDTNAERQPPAAATHSVSFSCTLDQPASLKKPQSGARRQAINGS